MTTPLPDTSGPSGSHRNIPDGVRRDRVLFARKWAYLVSTTTYIPLPHHEIESHLLALVDVLFDAATAEPFTTEPGRRVGTALVEMNCVGVETLHRTTEIVGKALLGLRGPRSADWTTERVLPLLGGLVAGYSEALRAHVLDQQESLALSLKHLTGDVQRERHAARGRLGEVTASGLGVAFVAPDGTLTEVNAAFAELLGWSAADLPGRSLDEVVSGQDVRAVQEIRRQLLGGALYRVHHRRDLLGADGEPVPVSLGVGLVRLPDGEPAEFVVTAQDHTEVMLLQRQLTRQSLHDVLTGLPNRQFFTTRLESALHRTGGTGGATVYHLDLDGFASVADGLGRQAGDHVLKVVADRLKSVVASERAVVARLEGDEFAVLVEHSADTPDPATVVDRINRRLAEPIYMDGHGVTVSTGIGVVARPPVGTDPSEVLRASDLALRRAKRHGRRQWRLFDPGQDARERASVALGSDMSRAWEDGRLSVGYRPVIALDGERTVAMEAVLRWNHPTLGLLGHDRCLELADESGLLATMGPAPLRAACARLVADGPDALPLAVLLTADQVADPHLVGYALDALREAGLSPGRLYVGVPVAAPLADPRAADTVRALAEAGVGTVLHRFGGGVDELACLESLPVVGVRIDRALADRAAGQPSRAVTSALENMVAAAHLMGRAVGVDGIDDRARADWWRSVGADLATGTVFGEVPTGALTPAR